MSCKSGIYCVNSTAGSALAVGSVYAPASVIRRFGPNIQMAQNGIVLEGSGYYAVDAQVNVSAAAAGNVVATLYKDGVAVPGAVATVTAVEGAEVVLPISALVRLNCNCQESNLTIVMSGVATTSLNLAIRVVKE